MLAGASARCGPSAPRLLGSRCTGVDRGRPKDPPTSKPPRSFAGLLTTASCNYSRCWARWSSACRIPGLALAGGCGAECGVRDARTLPDSGPPSARSPLGADGLRAFCKQFVKLCPSLPKSGETFCGLRGAGGSRRAEDPGANQRPPDATLWLSA